MGRSISATADFANGHIDTATCNTGTVGTSGKAHVGVDNGIRYQLSSWGLDRATILRIIDSLHTSSP